MEKGTTYVGLDVHQERIVGAVVSGAGSRVTEFRVGGDDRGIKSLVGRLEQLRGQGAVECVYEAGPTGYTLQRRLARIIHRI